MVESPHTKTELLALIRRAANTPEFMDWHSAPNEGAPEHDKIVNELFRDEDGETEFYLSISIPLATDYDRADIVLRDDVEIWIPEGFYQEAADDFCSSAPHAIRRTIRQLFKGFEDFPTEEGYHFVPVDLYSAAHYILLMVAEGATLNHRWVGYDFWISVFEEMDQRGSD